MNYLLLVSFYTLVLISAAMSCPTNCICKWKGGKQNVECVNRGLLALPDTIDSGTQVFDFSGNDLKTLSREQFNILGLLHLQKIFLSRCRLMVIDDRAFKALTNLIELDLSNNILSRIPTDVFADLPSLMKLNLNGNPFKILRANTFKNLKYLVSLELSRCELEIIESEAFYGLGALEMLRLDHNSLKYIPGTNTIPRRLHAIQLQQNPWFCDCKLADLYSWLNLTNVPQTIEATCDGPTRLRGAPIKQLDDQELACLPNVSPTSLYLEIPEGKNVSLVCRVNAQPEARISWHFQDRLLQNNNNSTTVAVGMRLYHYYIDEGTTEKVSELFILNTNEDDNGTFMCVAENQAGKAQSNYTIRIVFKDEPPSHNRRILPEYLMGLYALVATVIAFSLTCFITCLLRYRVKRKKRRKKEKSKELVLYNDSNAATGTPVITDRETQSIVDDTYAQRTNGGNLFVAEQVLSMKNVTKQEIFENIPSVSRLTYPWNTFLPEPNPDLINDTTKEKRYARNIPNVGIMAGSSTIQNDCLDAAYVGISSRQDELVGWRPNTAGSINIPSSNGVRTVSVNMCLNPVQTHADASSSLSSIYAHDSRLAKMATHFPPVLPATAFYRTLPHKRHSAATSKVCVTRYARDAELPSRSLQPASFEHSYGGGGGGDIRSNVEGYPKDSPVYQYTTDAPHVSFSETVQILGQPSETAIETDKSMETKSDYPIKVPLLGGDDLSLKKGSDKMTSKMKLKTTSKLSLKAKSKTDSPDEGYVDECADTTEV